MHATAALDGSNARVAHAAASPRAARVRRAHALASSTIELDPAVAEQEASGAPAFEKPGQAEDALFEQSDDVAFWREWNGLWEAPSPTLPQSNLLLDKLAQIVGASLQRDPLRAGAYWSYHLARSSFFLSQWIAAFLAYTATRQPGSQQSSAIMPGQTLNAMPRLFAEALSAFANDYAAIEAGHIALPYDASPTHRQFNPLFAARESALFLREAVLNLERRGSEAPPLWVETDSTLPSYYKSFHYQSDGYLSSRSASVYEASTEALFLGRQDAMQRLTLMPVARFVAERRALGAPSTPDRSVDGGGAAAITAVKAPKLDVLELGCGTGRFLTFLLDNFGAHFNAVRALEISPYYLEKARANVRYAASLRGWDASRSAVRFLLANAEAVPLEDSSQDLIVCVYVFHELPAEAQRNVAREVGRLLRPGGQFVLTDSLQLGDRPALDGAIPLFSNLNEPFYDNFLKTSFAQLFAEEAGLVPEWKGLRSATKTLSFRKPA